MCDEFVIDADILEKAISSPNIELRYDEYCKRHQDTYITLEEFTLHIKRHISHLLASSSTDIMNEAQKFLTIGQVLNQIDTLGSSPTESKQAIRDSMMNVYNSGTSLFTYLSYAGDLLSDSTNSRLTEINAAKKDSKYLKEQ